MADTGAPSCHSFSDSLLWILAVRGEEVSVFRVISPHSLEKIMKEYIVFPTLVYYNKSYSIYIKYLLIRKGQVDTNGEKRAAV